MWVADSYLAWRSEMLVSRREERRRAVDVQEIVSSSRLSFWRRGREPRRCVIPEILRRSWIVKVELLIEAVVSIVVDVGVGRGCRRRIDARISDHSVLERGDFGSENLTACPCFTNARVRDRDTKHWEIIFLHFSS